VLRIELEQMAESATPTPSTSLDVASLAGLLDVTCPVDVVVGTATITVRECLKLRPHCVVRLGQPSGAELNICVQGIVVAVGEVVIEDETTAVRIVQIAQPREAAGQP
jgi:flagellar motor switch protein FliN/FliY